ncbi:MAG: glucose-6-phosphate isomerase, partial [Terrimicrobiaceae bacterium]|nr:glucose-6-phosphate isomerase [Terrimicrobiaceae bacterium]
MDSTSLWARFQRTFLRYADLGVSVDISRMSFPDDFFATMQPKIDAAFAAMLALEGGAIANPDEGRMVGHYWLRDASLAPTAELRNDVETTKDDILAFAKAIHAGDITAANGAKFTDLLSIGIGGSALGPELVADALWSPENPVRLHFFDNTDPDGFVKVFDQIGDRLATTLVAVISKSGGTKESRNGMLAAQAAFDKAGIPFAGQFVAITGVDSLLDQTAIREGWLRRFPMFDWIGGRTSVMSAVGLLPMAVQGLDVPAFLEGAKAMDAKTRAASLATNAAMWLALMWWHAGDGRGKKDMVVLPYKDRLLLFSRYLQQLVMESLGKRLDLDSKVVNQGIAVYGNKGSTDQHAYVQQLRDGVNNFFVTFIEVQKGSDKPELEVEPGVVSSDYLQGFLRGTRSALHEGGRDTITVSIPAIDAYYLGALIALYERAVGFYGSLVNINAYHQPGVEAGKKAAAEVLDVQARVAAALKAANRAARTADELAAATGADAETIFHCAH